MQTGVDATCFANDDWLEATHNNFRHRNEVISVDLTPCH